MVKINLSKDEALTLLIRSIVVGQRKGAFSIKDAALLYSMITFLKKLPGHEEMKEVNDQSALNTLLRAVELANTKGAYSLEEADVINNMFQFFEKQNVVEEKLETIKEEEEPVEVVPETSGTEEPLVEEPVVSGTTKSSSKKRSKGKARA